MNRDKQIKSTDWLTKGYNEEELTRMKSEAIKEANAELRDKQIEEMYKDIYAAIEHNSVIDITHGGYIGINTDGLTRELYDDGYRKASDVAEEIFAEIDKLLRQHRIEFDMSCVDFYFEKHYAAIKKKYTQEK